MDNIQKKQCEVCKKFFDKPYTESSKRWAARRFCALICKNEWSKGKLFAPEKTLFKKGSISVFKGEKRENITGKNHGKWKGGRYQRPDGYIMVLVPGHPYGKGNGYIREHRYVMEQKIGRYLKPTEVVHHLNEIKFDNRIENLELLSGKGEHSSLHLSKNYWLGRK